jgi:hypothetical protein
MAIAHLGMRARPLGQAGFIFLASFLAVLFGLASAVLPAWFLFSALLVPAVAVLVLVRPEYALVALVGLTCGLIHYSLVPRMPLLGGSLAAADATLVMLAVYAVWMFAAQNGKADSVPVAGARWLAIALGLFGICFVIAVPMSLWYRNLDPTFVLGEARHFFYLFTLPIAVVILRQRERQRRFVIGIVVLGCLFSVGQVLQGVFNIPVFGVASRLVVLETLGREEYGTTRSITLGISVIVFSLLLTVGAYILGVIRKPLFLPVAGLLLTGIFLTFGRTTFAVVAVCVVVVAWWLNLRKLPQLAGWLLLFVSIGAGLANFWKPESLAAAYYRITSVGTEIESGYSALWRVWEAEAMLPHIQKHPLAGLGLGANYKGWATAGRPELDRYVHNAYVFIAGKMGLPALAFLLLTIGAIFAIGRRSANSDASPGVRIIGAAGAAMMISFLLAAVTEPHFQSDYSLVVIAIVGALAYLNARHAATVGVPAVPGVPDLLAAVKKPSRAKLRQ